MNGVKGLWASVQGDPVWMRKLNGWATVVWFVSAVPICLFLANSVPFLVFISVYAVVTGHLSTWQASRVEVEQKRQEQEKRDEDPAGEVVERIKQDPEIPTDNS